MIGAVCELCLCFVEEKQFIQTTCQYMPRGHLYLGEAPVVIKGEVIE